MRDVCNNIFVISHTHADIMQTGFCRKYNAVLLYYGHDLLAASGRSGTGIVGRRNQCYKGILQYKKSVLWFRTACPTAHLQYGFDTYVGRTLAAIIFVSVRLVLIIT